LNSPIIAILSSALLSVSSVTAAEDVRITITNPDGSPVSGIVAYATPLDTPLPEHKKSSIQLAQKDRAFSPFITVVQRGDEVSFINLDDFTHHIYSLSEQNRFSFKLKAGESNVITPEFASAQNTGISMGCNIHDWMSGYILVLDTPYFEQTDTAGNVQLSLAEPGRYTLTLWHPQLDAETLSLSKTLDIRADTQINWPLAQTFSASLPEVDEDAFNFLDKY
jgi:plastocyanin